MKRVLIDTRNGTLHDVLDMDAAPFPVGPDLEWREVEDAKTDPNAFRYDTATGTIVARPVPENLSRLSLRDSLGAVDVVVLLLAQGILDEDSLPRSWRDALGAPKP